jgi:hypothetical protein
MPDGGCDSVEQDKRVMEKMGVVSDSGQSSGCALLTETQQFDVLNALRQLTEACESVAHQDTEQTAVFRKRRHARRILNQLEHNEKVSLDAQKD